MFKKIFKIVIIIVLVAVIAAGIYVYTGFNGNPIRKFFLKKDMINYVEKNYPNIEYTVDKVTYNFKTSAYDLEIDVAGSDDTDFSVIYRDGKLTDDYEYRVNKNGNLRNRVDIYLNQDKYDRFVDDIFKDQLNFFFLTFDNYQDGAENKPNYIWNIKHPINISAEELSKQYPLYLIIYLEDKKDYENYDLEQITKQIKEAYLEVNIVVSEISFQ